MITFVSSKEGILGDADCVGTSELLLLCLLESVLHLFETLRPNPLPRRPGKPLPTSRVLVLARNDHMHHHLNIFLPCAFLFSPYSPLIRGQSHLCVQLSAAVGFPST